MNTYTFRAECPYDIALFFRTLCRGGVLFEVLHVTPTEFSPDTLCAIRSRESYEFFIGVLTTITDSHVMVETFYKADDAHSYVSRRSLFAEIEPVILPPVVLDPDSCTGLTALAKITSGVTAAARSLLLVGKLPKNTISAISSQESAVSEYSSLLRNISYQQQFHKVDEEQDNEITYMARDESNPDCICWIDSTVSAFEILDNKFAIYPSDFRNKLESGGKLQITPGPELDPTSLYISKNCYGVPFNAREFIYIAHLPAIFEVDSKFVKNNLF